MTTALSAILFDLDGVLISTDKGVVALWHEVLDRYGVAAADEELRRHAVGCSAEHTIDHFLGSHDAHVRQSALDDVRAAEQSLDVEVVAGAADLVAAVRRAGIRVGYVTGASSSRLSRALAALGAPRGDVEVVWGDAAIGKPAPDSYALAAERLGVSPAACLVVEDSVGGVAAAVAAGCPCIAIAATQDAEQLDYAGADVVIESLLSLTLSSTHDGGHVVATDEGDFYFPPPATVTA